MHDSADRLWKACGNRGRAITCAHTHGTVPAPVDGRRAGIPTGAQAQFWGFSAVRLHCCRRSQLPCPRVGAVEPAEALNVLSRMRREDVADGAAADTTLGISFNGLANGPESRGQWAAIAV